MVLTTLGIALSGYSLGSIAVSVKKFLNLDSLIDKTNNIQSLELYSSTQNPPIYVGTPHVHVPIEEPDDYNFLGSCGTFNEKDFKNYRYIGNPTSNTFICDLTKEKYKELLEKYDHESWIQYLIQLDADKKLYLHEIKLDEAYTINDNKIGFYHESKKYLSQYYIFITRYPLTFTSGVIGGLILYCN